MLIVINGTQHDVEDLCCATEAIITAIDNKIDELAAEIGRYYEPGAAEMIEQILYESNLEHSVGFYDIYDALEQTGTFTFADVTAVVANKGVG